MYGDLPHGVWPLPYMATPLLLTCRSEIDTLGGVDEKHRVCGGDDLPPRLVSLSEQRGTRERAVATCDVIRVFGPCPYMEIVGPVSAASVAVVVDFNTDWRKKETHWPVLSPMSSMGSGAPCSLLSLAFFPSSLALATRSPSGCGC